MASIRSFMRVGLYRSEEAVILQRSTSAGDGLVRRNEGCRSGFDLVDALLCDGEPLLLNPALLLGEHAFPELVREPTPLFEREGQRVGPDVFKRSRHGPILPRISF